MCLYTPAALCYENGQRPGCTITDAFIEAMDDKCDLATRETYVAYTESGVLASVNLVYSGLLGSREMGVQYTEETFMCNSDNSSLDFIVDESEAPIGNQAAYDGIRELRNLHGAELVAILAKNVYWNNTHTGIIRILESVVDCMDVLTDSKTILHMRTALWIQIALQAIIHLPMK